MLEGQQKAQGRQAMSTESAKDSEDSSEGDGGGGIWDAGDPCHMSSRPYSEVIKCHLQWDELIAKYRFGHHVGLSKCAVKCGSRNN